MAAAAPQQVDICNTDVFNDEVFNPIQNDNSFKEAKILYNNAKFYYACGQTVGALVSYSCAAVLLNVLIGQQQGEEPYAVAFVPAPQQPQPQANAAQAQAPRAEEQNPIVNKLKEIMRCCLSAVKDLQGKVNISSSSSKKDEETKEWDKICVKNQPLTFKKGSSECIFYEDVAGLAKEKKLVDYSLVYPLVYPNLYPKASKGILIYGPPGTGKTFLVKAAINELQAKEPDVGILFFAPSPGDLKGKFVGETEKHIEEVFTCASRAACKYESDCKTSKGGKKKYMSIIFMDEFDAIGPNRDTDTTGLAVNSVNTLLQMMDGVKSFQNVAVVAATNYPWNLDAAIIRRFDTQILINLPKENEIKTLLNMEINRMINLDADKSDFDYCQSQEDKEKSKDNDKETPLICKLQCERKAKTELRNEPPYNELKIDYYEQSKKGGEITGIINKLHESHFSNSDINRLLKAAGTYTGQLATKANLFYSTKMVKDFTRDKYISCLTQFKNQDEAITKSIEIIKEFDKDDDEPKFTDVYQLEPPKFTYIIYDGKKYFNIKCFLCKNENLFILDNPVISDIYIEFDTTVNGRNYKELYKKNILGLPKVVEQFQEQFAPGPKQHITPPQ